MTDLTTGPTPAAPAYVSNSPSMAATFAALRTLAAAIALMIGLAKLLGHGQIEDAYAYVQAHDCRGRSQLDLFAEADPQASKLLHALDTMNAKQGRGNNTARGGGAG